MVEVDPGKSPQGTGAFEFPPRRAVLLGASNIALGLPIVVESARLAWGSPLDLLVATGHGRSYGMTSRVLGRTLPGILQCGLWEALQQRPPAPTAALLTDIGNDILYGASADQIARWVRRCLEQLRPLATQLAITQLPLANLEELGHARFVAMRTLLFPKSQLTLPTALAETRALNEHLRELAGLYSAHLIEPYSTWYGIDPIHIQRRHRPHAWQQIFATWHAQTQVPCAHPSWRSWYLLRGARPLTRRMFGIEQRCTQPARRLADGSLVSLY